jgi:hypothetical protein
MIASHFLTQRKKSRWNGHFPPAREVTWTSAKYLMAPNLFNR